MAFSKVDATHAEIGDTKANNVHSETTETLRILRICKISTVIKTHIKTEILQQNIPVATYLPEGPGFQESAITEESEDINAKTAGFLKISSEILKRPMCVYQPVMM